MENVLFAGDDLKKRWKNLRDCFSKHLRSEKTRTGQGAKSICRYKSWPWAQHMDAFRPFLQFAQTESNIPTTDDIAESPEVVDDGIEAESSENVNEASTGTTVQERSTQISYIRNSRQKRKPVENSSSNNSSNVDKVIHFLNKRHSDVKNNCDSIDLTFQGYASSVKKLSNRRQTMVKYKIAKIIMEEELAQEAETQMESRPGTSFSNNSTASSYTSNIMPYDNSSLNSSNIREAEDNSSAATWYENYYHTNVLNP